jgi:hypothetical protein
MRYVKQAMNFKAQFEQNLLLSINNIVLHVNILGRLECLDLDWHFLALEDLNPYKSTLKMWSNTAEIYPDLLMVYSDLQAKNIDPMAISLKSCSR